MTDFLKEVGTLDGVFTNQFVILMYTSGYLSDGLYISKYIKWCVHQY